MPPLILVLVIEYLTRALKAVMQVGFKFHPRSYELQLCSLSFADDLLLFCRACPVSVECMMEAFPCFSH